MAGRINQVQLIRLTVLGRVKHRHWMRLDSDAAFFLQIHRVEQLLGHIARGDGAGHVQQPVGERGLPVVNVGDDAEIAYVCGVHLFLILIVILILIAGQNDRANRAP